MGRNDDFTDEKVTSNERKHKIISLVLLIFSYTELT